MVEQHDDIPLQWTEVPRCKRQFTADDSYYYDEQGYTEETCDECGKTFDVEVQSTVAWSCAARD